MLVPLRHVRPHVGFVWIAQPDVAASQPDAVRSLQDLMTAVESGIAFQTFVFGLVWSGQLRSYVQVPEDIMASPPRIFVCALQVSEWLGMSTLNGIQVGTQVNRTQPIVGGSWGMLLSWHNSARSSYRVLDVDPTSCLSFGQWKSLSGLVFLPLLRVRHVRTG